MNIATPIIDDTTFANTTNGVSSYFYSSNHVSDFFNSIALEKLLKETRKKSFSLAKLPLLLKHV
jgi:hypothetical protein